MPSSASADFGSCIIACGKRLLTVKIDGVARFNAAAAKVRAQSFTRTATQSSAARRRYGNDALHHRGGVSHGPACPRRAADEADQPPMRCTASGFTHRSSRTDSWVRAPANGGLPKVSFVAATASSAGAASSGDRNRQAPVVGWRGATRARRKATRWASGSARKR
jgi:hypothetical protein